MHGGRSTSYYRCVAVHSRAHSCAQADAQLGMVKPWLTCRGLGAQAKVQHSPTLRYNNLSYGAESLCYTDDKEVRTSPTSRPLSGVSAHATNPNVARSTARGAAIGLIRTHAPAAARKDRSLPLRAGYSVRPTLPLPLRW
jgi:hypothetical protein